MLPFLLTATDAHSAQIPSAGCYWDLHGCHRGQKLEEVAFDGLCQGQALPEQAAGYEGLT